VRTVPWLAPALLGAFLIVVFPLRAVRRRSRFGRTGRPGWGHTRPRAWNIADALVVTGFTVVFAGLALQGIDVLDPFFGPSGTLQRLAVATTVSATALAIWAQETMGIAWRADIAPTDQGELVTAGPFAVVRNPNYVAMATAPVATLLLAPNVCDVSGWLLLLAGLTATARAEEPQLTATYGQPYRDYASRVGRFLPFAGRLRG